MSIFQYPFTAIIGQDEMCLALKLSAVDPLMGGVLVMGHRGTGKSTAIRALANVLPKIKAVKNAQEKFGKKVMVFLGTIMLII